MEESVTWHDSESGRNRETGIEASAKVAMQDLGDAMNDGMNRSISGMSDQTRNEPTQADALFVPEPAPVEPVRTSTPVQTPTPLAKPSVAVRASSAARSRRRASMFVATALTIIALCGWLLAIRGGWIASATGPEQIVRAQIQDIGSDHFRAAYDLFSVRYRSRVPFEVWRDMVMSRRGMFRARELRFGDDEEHEAGGRAVLEAHVIAESGTRYVARFTLIHVQGRWWIDDIHWGIESEDRRRSFT